MALKNSFFFMGATIATCVLHGSTCAETWPQFRGPGGAAKSANSRLPAAWSDSERLDWKFALPGPGSSSPVVGNQHVFVTFYSGYGVDPDQPGELMNLTRHLVAVDKSSGSQSWVTDFPATQPEDEFQGFLAEHGYASSTPAIDAEKLYVFLGKSGVAAVDFNGQVVWQTSVGEGTIEPFWGSSSSLVLHEDLVIVNASYESKSIWALSKANGEVRWKFEDDRLTLAGGTPALICDREPPQLLLACPDTLLSISADDGTLVWWASIPIDNNVAPSVVVNAEVAYATGGLAGQTVAVRVDGEGDVSDSHVLWTSRHSSYVSTPLFHEGHLYWLNDQGMAFCLQASDGALKQKRRIRLVHTGGRSFYASPLLVGEHLLAVSRYNGAFIFAAVPELPLLANHQFESDDTCFNATPGISENQLFLRSEKYLYSIRLLDTP